MSDPEKTPPEGTRSPEAIADELEQLLKRAVWELHLGRQALRKGDLEPLADGLSDRIRVIEGLLTELVMLKVR